MEYSKQFPVEQGIGEAADETVGTAFGRATDETLEKASGAAAGVLEAVIPQGTSGW